MHGTRRTPLLVNTLYGNPQPNCCRQPQPSLAAAAAQMARAFQAPTITQPATGLLALKPERYSPGACPQLLRDPPAPRTYRHSVRSDLPMVGCDTAMGQCTALPGGPPPRAVVAADDVAQVLQLQPAATHSRPEVLRLRLLPGTARSFHSAARQVGGRPDPTPKPHQGGSLTTSASTLVASSSWVTIGALEITHPAPATTYNSSTGCCTNKQPWQSPLALTFVPCTRCAAL